MEKCPCGLDTPFESCCEPLIKEIRPAKTAEELMRSRYSAYATGNIDYIVKTIIKGKQDSQDRNSIKKWSEKSKWNKLDVINVEKGGPEDDEGYVEFIAHYITDGERHAHHEIAHFKKEDSTWFFNDSQFPSIKQYVRETPKVGRNDPCTCGSGKKFKKCCGK
ncbi:MAG: YchJ family protein [Proteobacteria bacterium]|nr:YchJ family protein [Pseudomonadota bacterium]